MKKKSWLLVLLLFFVGLGTLSAQTLTVQGVVRDETGEPGVGVSVVAEVTGQTLGTITDVDGRFRLNVPRGTYLRFSFIGYQTQRLQAKERMTVTLVPDAQQLEEVVITGMSQMDRRLFTGAADQLNAEDVKISGLSDVSRSLEGRSAGVIVSNLSGTFGTAPKIRVRGATSIYGSSNPLWVIDGVILENAVDLDADDLSSGDAETLIASAVAGLNADDIETFTVLKDGSATSIYGARAMAGVIVITTKKGKAGTSSISYTGEYTYRMIPSYRNFNIMNSQDQMGVYRDMEEKGWLNISRTLYDDDSGVYGKMYKLISSGDIVNTEEGRNEYLREAEYRNTNWFKELFNNNIMNTHSVSMSSGTEKAYYYASISAMFDPGWTMASKVSRYTANLNTTYNILKNLSLNMITSASYRDQKAPGTLSSSTNAVYGTISRNFDINPYSFALNSSRTLDPDETYTRNYADFNIKKELEENYMQLKVLEAKFQAEMKWSPIKDLQLAVLGSLKYQGTTTEHYMTEDSNLANAYRADSPTIVRDANSWLYTDPDDPYAVPVTILPSGGLYERTDKRTLSYDLRVSGTYNHTWNDTHILNLYGGVSLNKIDHHNTWFRGWGLEYGMGYTPVFSYLVFKRAEEDVNDYYTIDESYYREVAAFLNGTYSYKGRYTVNGTLRYEGSNKMGSSRQARWLPTWNVSGSWNMHEEEFFKNINPRSLSHLTAKLSYSLTADRGPNVSNSRTVIYATTPWRGSTGLNESGLYIDELRNSSLTYEKKHELNVGLDVGFVNNRINLEADWYKRNNYDLIGIVTTEGIGGEIQKYGNVATMKSNGVELSLSTKNIKTKDFSWSTTFIYSHIHNKVTALKTTNNAFRFMRGQGFTMAGYPSRGLFSLQFDHLDNAGLPFLVNTAGEVSGDTFNFQDSDQDHIKNNLVYEGPSDPTDLGSFGNIFDYKGFRLNIFFTYSFGNVIRLDRVFNYRYTDLESSPREFKNRWMVPGDEETTTIPTIASYRQYKRNTSIRYAYNAYNFSTERTAKGDFIRLKEISLSYDFPKELIQKISLTNLSLKLQATNLWLLYADSKLNGQDPEFINSGGVATPVPRQFTLTLRLSL